MYWPTVWIELWSRVVRSLQRGHWPFPSRAGQACLQAWTHLLRLCSGTAVPTGSTWFRVLTEKKLASKWRRVMNIRTSRTLPPSCMYCLGELSRMVGTPANMLFPSERDSAKSSSKPPPKARFLRNRNVTYIYQAYYLPSQSTPKPTLPFFKTNHHSMGQGQAEYKGPASS